MPQDELLLRTDDGDSFEGSEKLPQIYISPTENESINVPYRKDCSQSALEKQKEPAPVIYSEELVNLQSEDFVNMTFSYEITDLSPAITKPSNLPQRQPIEPPKCQLENSGVFYEEAQLSPPITKKVYLPVDARKTKEQTDLKNNDLSVIVVENRNREGIMFAEGSCSESCNNGKYREGKEQLKDDLTEDSNGYYLSQPIVSIKRIPCAVGNELITKNIKNVFKNIEAILHEESMNTNLDPPSFDSAYDPSFSLFFKNTQHNVNNMQSCDEHGGVFPKERHDLLFNESDSKNIDCNDMTKRKKNLSLASSKKRIKFVPVKDEEYNELRKHFLHQESCYSGFTCFSPTQNLGRNTTLLRANITTDTHSGNATRNSSEENSDGNLPTTKLLVGTKDGFWDL